MRLRADQRLAGAEYAAGVFDLYHLRGVVTHRRQVIADDHQRAAFVVPGVDVFPAQRLAVLVEGRVGFVEQQDGRVGQAHAGEQGALQFATGQCHQRSMFKTTEAPVFHYRLQALAALLRSVLGTPEASGD